MQLQPFVWVAKYDIIVAAGKFLLSFSAWSHQYTQMKFSRGVADYQVLCVNTNGDSV